MNTSINSFVPVKQYELSNENTTKTNDIPKLIPIIKISPITKQKNICDQEISTNKNLSRNVGFFLGNTTSTSQGKTTLFTNKETNRTIDSPLRQQKRGKRHSISFSTIPLKSSLMIGTTSKAKDLLQFLPKVNIKESKQNNNKSDNNSSMQSTNLPGHRGKSARVHRKTYIPISSRTISTNCRRRNTKFYIEYNKYNIDFLLNEPLTKDLEQKRKEFEEFKKDELITVFQSILIKKAQKGHYGELLKEILTLLDSSKIEYDLQKKILNEELQSFNNKYRAPYKELTVRKQKYEKNKQFEPNKDKFYKKQEINKRLDNIKQNLDKNEQMYNNVKRDLELFQEHNTSLISDLKYDLSCLKEKYNQNINEQKYYYSKLLSQGIDTRKEGLSWIVIHLYELNFQVTHDCFPKFLPKESIDYILEISSLEYKKRLQSSLLETLSIRRKDKKSIFNNLTKENTIQFTQLNNIYSKFIKESAPKTISQENLNRLEEVFTKYYPSLKDKLIHVIEDKIIQSYIEDSKLYFQYYAFNKGNYDNIQEEQHIKLLNQIKQAQDPDLLDLLKLRQSVKNLERIINKKIKETVPKYKEKLLNINKKDNIIEYKLQQQIYNACFGSKLVL